MKKFRSLLKRIILILFCISLTIFLYPQSEETQPDEVELEIELEQPDEVEPEQPIRVLSEVEQTLTEEKDDSFIPSEEPTEGDSITIPEMTPARIGILKAKFLLLDKQKIYRLKKRLNNQDIETYLSFIKGGGIFKDIETIEHTAIIESGSELMKHITYDHLIKVLDFVYWKSVGKVGEIKVPPFFYSTENKNVRFSHDVVRGLIEGDEELRKKVIESALGGLLNPDPKVRLVSTHLLRRLIPEPITWNFVNDRIKEHELGLPKDGQDEIDASSLETVKTFYYSYLTLNKIAAEKIIYAELLKLRRFISRFILVNQIKSGDLNTIKTIPVEVYKLLSRPIENEGYCRLPMNYLSSSVEIDVIQAGLENKDTYIQRKCSNSLIRILRTRGLDPAIKRKVFIGLIKGPNREKVAVGWTDEEINNLEDDKIDKMTKGYLKKVKLINSCPKDADDLYDDQDPYRFSPPKPLTDNPIYKSEFEKEPAKPTVVVSPEKKDLLEETYIFEY